MATFILNITAAIIWALWGGYVISTLWLWFMVPLGIPVIGALHGAGLSVLTSMLFGSRGIHADLAGREGKKPSEAAAIHFVVASVMPAFSLLSGWILHNLMTGQWMINIGISTGVPV